MLGWLFAFGGDNRIVYHQESGNASRSSKGQGFLMEREADIFVLCDKAISRRVNLA